MIDGFDGRLGFGGTALADEPAALLATGGFKKRDEVLDCLTWAAVAPPFGESLEANP